MFVSGISKIDKNLWIKCIILGMLLFLSLCSLSTAGTPITIIKVAGRLPIAATSTWEEGDFLYYITGGKQYKIEKSQILKIEKVIPTDVHAPQQEQQSLQSYHNSNKNYNINKNHAIAQNNSTRMPNDILAIVKRNIEKKYPDNYSVQKMLIEAQVKDYAFIQRYNPAGVPEDVFIRVKRKIESKYPNNFSVQKMLIEAQVKDYMSLHN